MPSHTRDDCCCTSDHLRARHHSTGRHLGWSWVGDIKYTQISVFLLWIDGIMKSVQKGLPALSLNLLLVIKMICKKQIISPKHSTMFWTKALSHSDQLQDGKGVRTALGWTLPCHPRCSFSGKVPKNLERGFELDPESLNTCSTREVGRRICARNTQWQGILICDYKLVLLARKRNVVRK